MSYGLKVFSPSGTVVIDGTSDMFRISASGNLSHTGAAGGGYSEDTVTLTGLGVQSSTPTMLGWVADGSTNTDDRTVGTMTKSNNVFVAASSGGAVTKEVVGMDSYARSTTRLDASSQLMIVLGGHSPGPSQTYYLHYYVLAQTAI